MIYRSLNISEGSETLLSIVMKLTEKLPVHYSKIISFLLEDLLGLIFCVGFYTVIYEMWSLNISRTKAMIMESGFRLVKNFAFVKKMLEKEQVKLEQDFEGDLKVKSRSMGVMNKTLPKASVAKSEIVKLMKDATKTENVKWETGRISGKKRCGEGS